VKDRVWDITNGNMKADEKGELTYIGGRGESMLDYVLSKSEGMGQDRENGDRK